MRWPRPGGAVEAIKRTPRRQSNCMCGFELKRGQVQGPKLSDGRTSDHASPFNDEAVEAGSLSIRDLGYFSVRQMAQRRRARGYPLARLRAGTALFTLKGQRLRLNAVVLP